jgi:hypothetical protein
MKKVLMFCDAAILPGVNISTNQIRSYGELRETPSEKLFDNLQLSFYVDNSFEVKAIFDEWVNSIQDSDTRAFNYYNDYTADIEINVLDKKNNVRYTMTLYESYVKALSPIQLDYAAKDVMKLSVSINYKYWKTKESAVSYETPKSSFFGTFGFGDGLPIPKDYFNKFSSFQDKFNQFTGSDLIVDSQQYIGSIIDKSGVNSDLITSANTIKGNVQNFGDNLNFDFTA